MVNSMKNNILEVLKDKHEAQTLIQINDLLDDMVDDINYIKKKTFLNTISK